MKKYAVIVAGGSGQRMKSTLPKQFMKIGAYPVLMHTIRKFTAIEGLDIHIIVVLPARDLTTWKKLVDTYRFTIPHQIITGGKTRIESVKNGLECIKENDGLVAIHDGVRPFVDKDLIENSFIAASKNGNAIAAVPLKDSIRKIEEDKSIALLRKQFRLIQTPQTFEISALKKAYEQPGIESLTDDASVIEKYGIPVHLIEGQYKNIKITTSEDLLIAEAFLGAEEFD